MRVDGTSLRDAHEREAAAFKERPRSSRAVAQPHQQAAAAAAAGHAAAAAAGGAGGTEEQQQEDDDDDDESMGIENLSQQSLLTKYNELREQFATVLQRNKELEALVSNTHNVHADY